MKAKDKIEKMDITLQLTLDNLQKKFPGKTMLTVTDIAAAYNLKNPQSIYNALRNPEHIFPRPVKRCGRWYWNIVRIAEDMAS